MSRKILIIDNVHDDLIINLTIANYECELNKDIDYNSFMDLKDDYIGIIMRSKLVMDSAAISSKPSLKFIIRIGSGMENIDVAFAERHGITCMNTPEGNAQAVAELTLGLLLSALRHIPVANDEVRRGVWLREKNKGTQIASRTIGIIGYGNTGKAFAKLLEPFGCKIYVYDKYNVGYTDPYIEEVSLKTIFQECDVVSLHINYMPENRYFVNEEFIASFKNPFILINTSRGMVVNTKDLVRNLKTGKILYACLDVLEYENTNLINRDIENWEEPMFGLSDSQNTILTPHIGGQTMDADKKHAEIAFKKIVNVLNPSITGF